MDGTAISTARLDLLPLPERAARALPDDRGLAARVVGAALAPDWPHADLLDLLPLQAAAEPTEKRFGVWVIIERETQTVIGDVGFVGPPGAGGVVELGYSVVLDRRRRGYATEAARALVEWALLQPVVRAVVAGCATDNVSSICVLERLGFSRTGEADGELRWRYGALRERR